MDVGHAQYNTKNYSKHEILLLYLLYLYFTPDWVGKYLGTYHNSVTHIYSELSHNVYNYRDIFFHGYEYSSILNITTIKLYIILIGFKNRT